MNKPEVIRRSKCARLHELIASPQLDFLMKAHNGISARIVEEASFKGIWASGLALRDVDLVQISHPERAWVQASLRPRGRACSSIHGQSSGKVFSSSPVSLTAIKRASP
jgi:hypothetical protein